MKTYMGRRSPLATSLTSLLLASFATGAQSQDTATQAQITEVIVTGTRVPKAVDKIPGAITVIGEAELAHTQAVTMDATAVLSRTVPGYSESSQAMSNTGETLRGRNPLRLFDGVPQGSPLREGTRSGTFTDMGVIERIEVINGPSAAEGIGAAGGIINYISRSPTVEGTEVDLTARYSSQFENDSDDWKIGATLTHKQDNFDVLAAVSFIDRGMTYDGNGRSHRLEHQRLGGRLRIRESVLQGRPQFRRQQQPAPAVERQPLQHHRQGQLHPGRWRSHHRRDQHLGARPAAGREDRVQRLRSGQPDIHPRRSVRRLAGASTRYRAEQAMRYRRPKTAWIVRTR